MNEIKTRRTLEDTSEKNEYNKKVLSSVQEGDLLRIEFYSRRYDERVEKLFEVSYIPQDRDVYTLDNKYMDFLIRDDEFLETEYDPVIKSVIYKSELDAIEHRFESISLNDEDLTPKSLVFKKNI